MNWNVEWGKLYVYMYESCVFNGLDRIIYGYWKVIPICEQLKVTILLPDTMMDVFQLLLVPLF